MAGPRLVLKNQNLFFGGKSYAGSVTEWNPPKITANTEEFRAGGLDVALKLTMGMNPLDTDFTVISFDPVLLGSVYAREGQDASFIIRQAYEDWDGTITAREVIMRGKVLEKDEGTHKAGQQSNLKIQMNLLYYSDTFGGQVVDEIDVINMVWNKGGVDSLSDIRAAIGM